MRKDLRTVFRFSIWNKLFISVLVNFILLEFLLTGCSVLVLIINIEFSTVLVSLDATIDVLDR